MDSAKTWNNCNMSICGTLKKQKLRKWPDLLCASDQCQQCHGRTRTEEIGCLAHVESIGSDRWDFASSRIEQRESFLHRNTHIGERFLSIGSPRGRRETGTVRIDDSQMLLWMLGNSTRLDKDQFTDDEKNDAQDEKKRREEELRAVSTSVVRFWPSDISYLF